MIKAAIDFSDGIIFGSAEINPELKKYVKESGKPLLEFQPMEKYINAYSDFYDEILVNESVEVN
jgi:starch synthase